MCVSFLLPTVATEGKAEDQAAICREPGEEKVPGACNGGVGGGGEQTAHLILCPLRTKSGLEQSYVPGSDINRKWRAINRKSRGEEAERGESMNGSPAGTASSRSGHQAQSTEHHQVLSTGHHHVPALSITKHPSSPLPSLPPPHAAFPILPVSLTLPHHLLSSSSPQSDAEVTSGPILPETG